jgi:hypothetical protein
VRDDFVRQGMNGGLKGLLDSIRAFSESDFTEDLRKFDKPTRFRLLRSPPAKLTGRYCA